MKSESESRFTIYKDETRLCFDRVDGKCFDKKGSKTVYMHPPGGGKCHPIVVIAESADGVILKCKCPLKDVQFVWSVFQGKAWLSEMYSQE